MAGRYEDSIRETRETLESERRAKLDEARREGSAQSASARDAAEREIERARGDLAKSLAEARASVRGEAEQLARDVATRVLGRSL